MTRTILVLALVAAAGRAEAYPQFQLSTGAVRCNQCHYAPAGGGLINQYGRDEAADTISGGGNGDLLHGLWDPPDWFDLGGDFRGAALVNDAGATEGADVAAFPMMAELYTRFAWRSLSFTLFGGYPGIARNRDPLFLSNVVSREHYFMWRPQGTGPYARVGRFFAPYGLRWVEHPSYVRRYLGFDTYEETYNASVGYLKNEWEVHGTFFMPDFLRPVGHQGTGVAVYGEMRLLDDTTVVAAQTRLAFGEEKDRYAVGGVAKYWWEAPKLLFSGEVDLVHERYDLVDATQWQLASWLGATWFPLRGWMFGGALERWDENLSVKDVARDAVSLQAQWFPIAHLEVMLYGRLQLIGAGNGGDPAELLMLQVHYYL